MDMMMMMKCVCVSVSEWVRVFNRDLHVVKVLPSHI